MNREAVIEFVLEHYRAENQGRVDYDECFGDHLECLSDANLLACLAWYEAEDWLDQVYPVHRLSPLGLGYCWGACGMPAWMLLLLAIAAEVIGTSCLKLSDGFSRLWPSVVVLLAYSTSMLLLSQVVKTITLGITYAMWSGIGIVAIVLVGVLAYRQTPTAMQLFGMALIAAGVVTLNVSGPGHG